LKKTSETPKPFLLLCV